MRRLIGAGLILGMLAFSFGLRHTARAQTSTQDQLTALLLTADDVPGFKQNGDLTINFDLPGGQGTVTGVTRGFAPTASGSNVALVTELLVFSGAASNRPDFATLSEAGLRGAANGSGQGQQANFTLTGPLGVGQQDQSAEWEIYSPSLQTWLVVYADMFQEGKIYGVVAYLSPVTEADPGRVAAYAQLQDSKIATLGAQPPSGTATATPTPAATVTPASPLQPALLTTADLPAGWQVWVTPPDTSTTSALCGTDLGSGVSTAEAEADFRRGQLGPFLTENIDEYPTGQAQPIMDQVLATLKTCSQFQVVQTDGTAFTFSLTPLDSPAIGDEAAAYVLTVTQGSPLPLHGEAVFVRRGDVVITLTYLVADGSQPDPTTVANLATKADSKLVAFLGSVSQ